MEFPVSDMRQMIGLDGFASQPKCNANNLFFTCVPLKYQACGAASAAAGAKNATQSIDRNNKNIGAAASRYRRLVFASRSSPKLSHHRAMIIATKGNPNNIERCGMSSVVKTLPHRSGTLLEASANPASLIV